MERLIVLPSAPQPPAIEAVRGEQRRIFAWSDAQWRCFNLKGFGKVPVEVLLRGGALDRLAEENAALIKTHLICQDGQAQTIESARLASLLGCKCSSSFLQAVEDAGYTANDIVGRRNGRRPTHSRLGTRIIYCLSVCQLHNLQPLSLQAPPRRGKVPLPRRSML